MEQLKEEIEYEIKPKGRPGLGLSELWAYRELFYFFTWRDIRVRYKQTVLGVAWVLLQPLLMMVAFTMFFHNSLNVETVLPYPLFSFLGLMLWTMFSSGLTTASNSMLQNANIIKKIYFPRLIIPVSAVLVAVFDFFMTILPLIGLLIYFAKPPLLQALWMIPLSLLSGIMATFGPGCLLAALNVKYRDFRYVTPFLIQIMLFASNVIYPLNVMGGMTVQRIVSLNPISGAISLLRSSFSGVQPDWISVCISTCSSLFLFIIGLWYFRRTESQFADIA